MDKQISIMDQAADFNLMDTQGQQVQLSAFFGKKVVLVFNRGFA